MARAILDNLDLLQTMQALMKIKRNTPLEQLVRLSSLSERQSGD